MKKIEIPWHIGAIFETRCTCAPGVRRLGLWQTKGRGVILVCDVCGSTQGDDGKPIQK